jgi:hypothetical protein
MVRSALAGVAVAALLAPAPATAAARGSASPWATVNVCDTAHHPDAIGVRASMPSLGRRGERHVMRIRVQWRDPSAGWTFVGRAGDSGRIDLGRGRRVSHETGRLFRFESPPDGRQQLLRGVVVFEWRVRGRVVQRRTAVTEAGHRSAAGSDPKGYSAASCELA